MATAIVPVPRKVHAFYVMHPELILQGNIGESARSAIGAND